MIKSLKKSVIILLAILMTLSSVSIVNVSAASKSSKIVKIYYNKIKKSSYDSYLIVDINNDGKKELFLLNKNTYHNMKMYRYYKGKLRRVYYDFNGQLCSWGSPQFYVTKKSFCIHSHVSSDKNLYISYKFDGKTLKVKKGYDYFKYNKWFDLKGNAVKAKTAKKFKAKYFKEKYHVYPKSVSKLTKSKLAKVL